MATNVRPARFEDIAAMHRLRLAVRENRLAAGAGIDERSYQPFVTDGAAWVAMRGERLVGFAAVDRGQRTVWAMFVDPGAEREGVGTMLHRHMLAWAAEAGLGRLRLTTEAGSRADGFYRAAGWRDAGLSPHGERCFVIQLPSHP